jgi:hypothetical protein
MTEVKNKTVDGFVGRNEMDSHADTSCAGANWKAIELTGLTCDVSPFTQDYDAVKDVPVATCATAVADESGETIILVCHQMLYFGTSLPHSLLNPNQLRLGGTPVRDDPTQ